MWVQAYRQLVKFLHHLCLYRAFWGRDWAGTMGLHKSRANLVVTSGQRSLNLWGSWGERLAETGHLRHLLLLFLSKEFDHSSSRGQCHLSPSWNVWTVNKVFWF